MQLTILPTGNTRPTFSFLYSQGSSAHFKDRSFLARDPMHILLLHFQIPSTSINLATCHHLKKKKKKEEASLKIIVLLVTESIVAAIGVEVTL